jgi:cytoskeletal protein CcmA (bactofilin family)
MGTSRIADETGTSGQHATYLNSTSRIIGNIVIQNSARIDGKVEGDIVTNGKLSIGESAVVSARIQAPTVVVCGKVSGDISAQSIEIGPRAKVVGNLTSAILNVEHGAVLDGRCSVSGLQTGEVAPREVQGNAIRPDASNGEPSHEQPAVGPVTKDQRAGLRARGHSDAAIEKMTPIELHTILGLS